MMTKKERLVERVRLARKLYAGGMNVFEISNRIHTSVPSITRYVTEMEHILNEDGSKQSDVIKERKLEKEQSQVDRILRARRLRSKGWTYKAISKEIGRGEMTIRNYIQGFAWISEKDGNKRVKKKKVKKHEEK